MLTIVYDNLSVTPMRPEKNKTFSSEDVPHGTNSVYIKAASILSRSHGKNISIPQFSKTEKDAMIAARKLSISAVSELSNPKVSDLEQVEILNPTSEEILEEFSKKDDRNRSLYINEEAAETSLIDTRKTELATLYVNERIKQFLDVPEITDEWKAQFTTKESD